MSPSWHPRHLKERHPIKKLWRSSERPDFHKKKSETELTARVLKKKKFNHTHKSLRRTLFLRSDNTGQVANFLEIVKLRTFQKQTLIETDLAAGLGRVYQLKCAF